jgi:hypothetical protein
MKAELPPSLVMAQATLAGAPPGALMKPVDSARETPAVSGTKSISISPKATIEGLGLVAEIVIESSGLCLINFLLSHKY